MRSLEHSHLRLGLAKIDIALIHDVDFWTTKDRDVLDERFKTVMDSGFKALDELRKAGVIGAIGVGINESDTSLRFIQAGDFDCMLLAGRYTLLEQGGLDGVPARMREAQRLGDPGRTVQFRHPDRRREARRHARLCRRPRAPDREGAEDRGGMPAPRRRAGRGGHAVPAVPSGALRGDPGRAQHRRGEAERRRACRSRSRSSCGASSSARSCSIPTRRRRTRKSACGGDHEGPDAAFDRRPCRSVAPAPRSPGSWPLPGATHRAPRSRCAAAFPGNRRSRHGAARRPCSWHRPHRRKCRRSPAAVRSSRIRPTSWWPCGVRAMKRGGSSGNTRASACGHHVGEFVLRDAVPDVEEETPARPQHAARLPVALDLVGKEHRAELAGHDVEAPIAERQRQRVGLLPLDAAAGLPPRCLVEHRLVEIGRHDARRRAPAAMRALASARRFPRPFPARRAARAAATRPARSAA